MCEAFITGCGKSSWRVLPLFLSSNLKTSRLILIPGLKSYCICMYLLWLILFVYPLNGNRSIPSPRCLIKFGPLLSVPCRSSSTRSLVAAVLIELDHSRWPQSTTNTTSLPENVKHVENIFFLVCFMFSCFPYFQFLQPSTLFDLSSPFQHKTGLEALLLVFVDMIDWNQLSKQFSIVEKGRLPTNTEQRTAKHYEKSKFQQSHEIGQIVGVQ